VHFSELKLKQNKKSVQSCKSMLSIYSFFFFSNGSGIRRIKCLFSYLERQVGMAYFQIKKAWFFPSQIGDDL